MDPQLKIDKLTVKSAFLEKLCCGAPTWMNDAERQILAQHSAEILKELKFWLAKQKEFKELESRQQVTISPLDCQSRDESAVGNDSAVGTLPLEEGNGILPPPPHICHADLRPSLLGFLGISFAAAIYLIAVFMDGEAS